MVLSFWSLPVPRPERSRFLHTAAAALVLVLVAPCCRGSDVDGTTTAMDGQRTGILESSVVGTRERFIGEHAVGGADGPDVTDVSRAVPWSSARPGALFGASFAMERGFSPTSDI